MSDLSEKEKQVDVLLGQGKKKAAVALLFQLVTEYARRKNFPRAEAMRDRIYDADDMALNEIIKSGEIIEQEKSQGIDQKHRVTWAKLYNGLTTEEANTLYYALKSNKKKYEPDAPVFRQGQHMPHLFFIDQGQVKQFYSQNDGEKLLGNLGPGEIAGLDSFFNISVCTTSLVTLTRACTTSLSPEDYRRWQETMPTLATKIRHFCDEMESAIQIMRKKGMNRREHSRLKMDGPIGYQVLRHNGQPLGREFRGDIADISVGGLSFFMKTSNKQQALLLLGRRLKVRFGPAVSETIQTGIITGVIHHLFTDYSIHLKFDTPVSQALVDKMAVALPAEKGPAGKSA